jgi:hypothetical protein
MNYRAVASMLFLTSLLLLAGCDKASPVAPNGTILAISANPSQIGLTGSSTITIVGRKPDGNPLNPGTEIRLSTDIGTITSVVTTNATGTATAIFQADGRTGTATITAMTGSGTTMVTTKIQVGQGPGSKPGTPLVTVSPSNIPVNGSATVTVVARNADGSPAAAGQPVILTTTLGTLRNSRPLTHADGTATTTLDAGTQAGSATVTAIFGSSDAGSATLTIRDAPTLLSLQADQTSVQRNATTTVNLTAFVANSEGLPLQGIAVQFSASIPGLANTVVFTDNTGQARNTLIVKPENIPSGTKTITVTAQVASGSGGSPLSSSVVITVNG